MTRRRWLFGGALAVVALAAAVAVYAATRPEPIRKRGSAKQEFVTTEAPKVKPPPRQDPTPWAMYGYDRQRQHVSPYDLKPPYRRVWQIDAHDTVEFPPSVGFGKVFVPQQKGLFFALDSRTGHLRWRKKMGRCAAASPALAHGVVYQSYMDFVPCPQGRPGASGFVIAWNAKNGHRIWKWSGQPVESSPLVVGNTVYVGSWDHGLHALNAKTGHQRWRFEADDQVNTSPAYSNGTLFFGTYAGSVYAIDARTGHMRWKSTQAREFYYATPTVAYGRVYIGSSDGTEYVYGAKSGRLLWARPLGSYIYGAAAVYKRRVFVGTYDGSLYSLDAATGDVKWRISTAAAVHSAPTVMHGLVYYATCSSCGSAASRAVKHGPDGTHAVNWKTGHQVWSFPAGKYANPVVADTRRIYVTGQSAVYALAPRH